MDHFISWRITNLRLLHLTYLAVDEPPIPETLPEVPAKAGEAVEEAEFEEVADAEVGKGAEVGCGLQK